MYQTPHTQQIPNEVLFPVVAEMLRQGKEVTLTPRGSSMQPFIRGGVDVVTLRVVDGAVREGDILLFQLPPRVEGGPVVYVLHRLIRVEGEELTLRGDGNVRGEEHCLRGDVLGRVVSIRSGRVMCPFGRNKGQGVPKPLRMGWRWWQWAYPLRSLLLKVDKHFIRFEKFRFYRKWL